MKSNRRNFLKTTGLTGIGLLGLSHSQYRTSSKETTNSKLKHIKTEAEKNYKQIFNMCGYAAPKLNEVKIGIIGIGSRGSESVKRLSHIEGVEIKGLCDIIQERALAAKEKIKSTGHNPIIFSNNEDSWREMCSREDIDLVYIATPWKLHAPMAIYAMEHGKHVAVEVPVATTVEDCWKLVQTSERTKKHCVMLENCCYDDFELLTLNLARHGLFGDIIHCEGAYIHKIATSLFHRGDPNERWRLKENFTRNGNLYSTHGLGPIAQVMNINRGNKMEYLVSTSTKDFMMNNAAKEFAESDNYFEQFVDKPFRGNMNVTTIKTISGQTIMLQHDITTPRPYSRLHLISGTKGIAQKYPLPPRLASGHKNWLSQDEILRLEEKYNHPLIKKEKMFAEKLTGHIDWMMDFIMDWRLIDCLRNGLPVDIDVYDAASWSIISPLSEWSVANKSAPINIPDFTMGSWKENKPHEISLENSGTTGLNI